MKHDWKRLLLFLAGGLFFGFGVRAAGRSPGDPEGGHVGREPMDHARRGGEATGLLVDLGNAVCPINGEEPDGETWVEWNHLRVGFCCPGCDRKFLADPEKALDEAGVEWRAAAKAVRDYLAAEEPHRAHLLAEIRRRWNVVREPEGG